MCEINEKDLEKATGGLSGNQVKPNEKCDRWEAKSEKDKNLPELLHMCSSCVHFSTSDLNYGTCELR